MKLNLKQIHDIAKFTNGYGEFKAAIDKKYNGTPETVMDNSDYILLKTEEVFCSPPNTTYCKLMIEPNYDCNQCKWKH